MNDPAAGPSVPYQVPMQQTRVFIVDEHPVVVRGLAYLVTRERGWEHCGSASDYETALQQIAQRKPDLLITGLDIKGRSGLELVRRAKAQDPKLRILIFSMHEEAIYAPRAIRAGAAAYVMKREDMETLLTAMDRVL